MNSSLTLRAALVSVLIFLAFILAWHLSRRGTGAVQQMDPGIRQADGRNGDAGQIRDARATRCRREAVGARAPPVLRQRPERQGRRHPARVLDRARRAGYLLAVLVAIPIGFLIGMSPLFSKALDPFIQVLKPISPLAWMPLALYTIKDSSLSAIFVIFHLFALADADQHGVRRRGGAQGMAQRRAHARSRHAAPRLHDHPARCRADDPHRHAHLDRHRVARHRRGRDARRRNRHWLLRLERME